MKFFVKDEDGKQFEVEELEEKEVKDDEIVEVEKSQEDALSNEEIAVLRKLLPYADKIIASFEETKDEEIEEEKEEEILDEDEEILDTDEEVEEEIRTAHDSKRSFGSIEKKQTRNSSYEDEQEDIANAWAKRYGGIK